VSSGCLGLTGAQDRNGSNQKGNSEEKVSGEKTKSAAAHWIKREQGLTLAVMKEHLRENFDRSFPNLGLGVQRS